MLIAVTTLLARAKRQHWLVPFVFVYTPQMSEAVVQAASHRQVPVVLVIDVSEPLSVNSQAFVQFVLTLAQQSRLPVAVQLQVEGTALAVKAGLASGVPSLVLAARQCSLNEWKRTTVWSVKAAIAAQAELIGTLPNGTFHKAEEFVRETGVTALSLPVQLGEKDHSASLSALHQLAAQAKVPVIATDLETSHRLLGRAHKLGLAGFWLKEVPVEAYTAGIRTGLRNRTVVYPYDYERHAKTAVESSVRSYLNQ